MKYKILDENKAEQNELIVISEDGRIYLSKKENISDLLNDIKKKKI